MGENILAPNSTQWICISVSVPVLYVINNMALLYMLKCSKMIAPALCLLLRVDLGSQALSCFNITLRCFSISVNNGGILVEII